MKSNKFFSAHHISTAEVFASTKFAANADNSLYFVGADTATTYVGVPDIKYEDYCIIKPYGYTYTHGRFNVQSIQSADATHMGLADALEVRNALNAVSQSAAQGLKCVDLSTYQGTTVGEIVKHIGATTADYVNGYDYKYNSTTTSESILTLTDIDFSVSNLVPASQETASVWTSLRTPFYPHNTHGTDEEDSHSNNYYLIFYAVDGESIDDKDAIMVGYNLDTENPTVQVGDWIYVSVNWDAPYIPDQIVSINGTKFTTESGHVYDTTSFDYESYFNWFINEDGEEVVICGSSIGATETFIYPKLHLSDRITYTVTDYDPSISVTISSATTTSSWVQTDAQPSIELEYDNAPTTNSTNLVNSGNIKRALDNNQRVFYAVTETAGATAVKEFTIPNFPTETINSVKTPLKGTILIAQCANEDARTAQLKFKVNDGGEFPIWYGGSEQIEITANQMLFGNTNRRYLFVFNGTHWCWLSKGDDYDTQYTAGTGLKLSSNQFSLNVPRVTKSANSIPGVNSARIEEYQNGSGYNLPLSNQLFHILTIEGDVNTGATQLALCLTGTGVYYRFMYNSVWQPWLRLDNPTMDSTPTAGNTSNVVSSAGIKTYVDTQVATKSNVIFRQWVTQ